MVLYYSKSISLFEFCYNSRFGVVNMRCYEVALPIFHWYCGETWRSAMEVGKKKSDGEGRLGNYVRARGLKGGGKLRWYSRWVFLAWNFNFMLIDPKKLLVAMVDEEAQMTMGGGGGGRKSRRCLSMFVVLWWGYRGRVRWIMIVTC